MSHYGGAWPVMDAPRNGLALHQQQLLGLGAAGGAFFVPVHLLAWPTAWLVAFAADEENQSIMQQAQQTLLVLLIVGCILFIVLAKYNVRTL